MELEGLRGVAAIVVALYHNLLAFYAFAFLGAGSGLTASVQHMRFEDNIHGSPLAVFLSGTFAVAIFFVLSGFVLSIGFVQTKRIEIIKSLAAKRYLRLMLPALASIVVCFMLIKLGLSHTQDAGAITRSSWLLGQWAFTPNFIDAIRGGVFGIFIDGANIYNNVLWTMSIEFAGSFLVFAALLLFGQSRYRWVMYVSLVILTYNTWFLGFVLGLVLAELYASGYIQQQRRKLIYLIPMLLAGLVLGGFPIGESSHSLYSYFTAIKLENFNYMTNSLLLGATLLVFVALWSSQFADVLRSKYISNVGKYTFSLYLTHIPILYTFTTWMFIFLHSHMGYNRAAFLSIIFSIPLVAGATVMFERYIDKRSVAFASYCADIYFGKREMQLNAQVANIRHLVKVCATTFHTKVNRVLNRSIEAVEPELE